MYSTCIFCHSELGVNEAIEHFPVGRRLAFDAAKGRLWVVCRKCERWNLTPLEERWEAIEECERAYRATKLRVSTDHIGLARISEGLELVRIGQPQRPEFAAWRYGDQFGRRRRKTIIQGTAIAVGLGAIPFVGPALGISFGGFGGTIFQVANFSRSMYFGRRVVAQIHDGKGNLLQVRQYDAPDAVMLEPTADQPWGLRVKHRVRSDTVPWWEYAKEQGQTDLRGDDAIRAAARLLPRVNATGASARQIERAVAIATEYEDPSVPFERAARLAATRKRWWKAPPGKGATLTLIPAELRLALEMVSHDESERRALQGELAILEEAWKEAEEIAGISDDLFLPEEISQQLAKLKQR
jgi:hypothetical protein